MPYSLEEIQKELQKHSQAPVGDLKIWLSRWQNQPTNEGFGYLIAPSSEAYNHILTLKVVVRKVRIQFKKPVSVTKMRDYLADLKKRQIHVSCLSKKVTAGKKKINRANNDLEELQAYFS